MTAHLAHPESIHEPITDQSETNYLRDIEDELAKPFPTEYHEHVWVLVSTANNHWAKRHTYVDARHVQQRLDEVFGWLGWSQHLHVDALAVTCNLTITRPKITREDTAQIVKGDVKAAATDAFKRAACALGVGRYLYTQEAIIAPVAPVSVQGVVKLLPIDHDLSWPSNPKDVNAWKIAASKFSAVYTSHPEARTWLLERHGETIKTINSSVSESLGKWLKDKINTANTASQVTINGDQ